MHRIKTSLVLFIFINITLLPLLSEEDEWEIEIEIEDETETEDTEEKPPAIEIEQDEEPSSPGIIQSFVDNSKIKIQTRYDWFFQELDVEEDADPAPDDQAHMLSQYISYSSFFQVDFFRFDLATCVAIGNPQYTYASGFENMHEWEAEDWLQDANNRRHYFSIEECYMSLFFPICDIIMGKKIFVNTLSSVYTPADNYKVIDSHDPFDVREIGRMQAQINFYAGNFIFSFLLWPYYEGGKDFSSLSRWGYYKALEELGNGTIMAPMLTVDEKIYPSLTWENVSYLGKIKSTLSGWDIFVSAFHGLAGNTVSKITETFPLLLKEQEVVPVLQFTGGFATTISNLEFHAEALYNYTYELKDDHFIRYVGGMRSTFDELGGIMDKIEITLEYGREDMFESQDNDDYTDSTEEKRFFKNDLLADILLQFTPKFKINMYGQYEINDNGFILSGSLDWRLVDNLEISLGAQGFVAPEETDFYWWRDNSRLITMITLDY